MPHGLHRQCIDIGKQQAKKKKVIRPQTMKSQSGISPPLSHTTTKKIPDREDTTTKARHEMWRMPSRMTWREFRIEAAPMGSDNRPK